MTFGEPSGSVEFSLEEVTVIIEDLMCVADEIFGAGDEVNAFLIDQVANTLLDRAFGSSE